MTAPRRIAPEPARRGWCPSLARPMPTGDGLLARVHPPLGVLTPVQARAVAQAARRFGNGHIDVTARANLQIRGVAEETRMALAALLESEGLGDVRGDGGPQRLTLTAPLAGPDVLALARTIEAAALSIPGLPAKTLVTIAASASLPGRATPTRQNLSPGPGSPSADAPGVREGAAVEDDAATGSSWTEADIRLVIGASHSIALALADPEAPDWFAGIDADRAPAIVDAALRALAASGRRRMRDLPAVERADLAVRLGFHAGPAPSPAPMRSRGLATLDDGRTSLLLDAPFGRCTADALHRLADRAEAMGSDIHLSPTRGFALVTGDAPAARSARDALAAFFLTEADDPRGAVAACPGAPACACGSTPTLADAGRLAEAFRPFAARGLAAHVSGCAKGCAHPGAADLTLVARDGTYDVVLAGRPDALPAARLTFEEALERVRRADPALPPRLALDHAFRNTA